MAAKALCSAGLGAALLLAAGCSARAEPWASPAWPTGVAPAWQPGAWQPGAWQPGAGQPGAGQPPQWDPGAEAARFALAQLGRPYCWGGRGPGCFDCSGLTQAAWRAAGVAIPRTAADQQASLAPRALGALQPGDVVWRPGHVGLYVGNGWVVHAPGRGKSVSYQPVHTYRSAHHPL